MIQKPSTHCQNTTKPILHSLILLIGIVWMFYLLDVLNSVCNKSPESAFHAKYIPESSQHLMVNSFKITT